MIIENFSSLLFLVTVPLGFYFAMALLFALGKNIGVPIHVGYSLDRSDIIECFKLALGILGSEIVVLVIALIVDRLLR